MGRESCQGLGLPCFFSAPRVYPTTGCHNGPQDPRNRLWSGWAEESPLHTPKEHLLGHYQTGHSRVPILQQCVNPGKRGFYSLPPGTVYTELAADRYTYGSSGDCPTYGYGDRSKGLPQLNWEQHWPACRALGTGTKPGSGQVVWGQDFLWQVSVPPLQTQSWQSMLMLWPGCGGMIRDPDL